MKILILILLAFLVCFSCTNQNQNEPKSNLISSDNSGLVEDLDIVGKVISYTYGESIYHVHVLTDSTLYWEAVQGSEKGVTANEDYKLHRVDNHKIFISWGEENGLSVSQVLDFEKGIVYNHLLRDRDVSIGMGKIDIVE